MVTPLDPTVVIPGFHGELYDLDTGQFLAWAPTWQAQINVSNTDYQPAASAMVYAVIQNYNVTLTLTETVVQDALLLKRLVDALKAGTLALFNFRGVLRGNNGTQGTYIFRHCVPDGAIDIANVDPGNVMSRDWSFRVNEPPDLQDLLSY